MRGSYKQYLRSDHWSVLRTQVLVKYDATCAFCNKKDVSNDVHHLKYKNLKDVTVEDCRVLCRDCHENLHEVMENDYAWWHQIKALHSNEIWSLVLEKMGKIDNSELSNLEVHGLLDKPLSKFRNPAFFSGKLCVERQKRHKKRPLWHKIQKPVDVPKGQKRSRLLKEELEAYKSLRQEQRHFYNARKRR